MRRLVFVFMMLLLPLQSTWAAAAAYCAHEVGAGVNHIGHHQHDHKAAKGDVSKLAKSTALGNLDTDCDYCHHSTAPWLAADGDVLPALACAMAPPEDPLRIGSHIDSGPERPDRSLA